jgi:hypothetical protein
LPALQEAARSEAERARVAAEGDELRARVLRSEQFRAAADSLRKAAPGAASTDPVNAIRRSLLETLERSALGDVRLSVTPAPSPAVVRAQISAEGRFEDLVALSGRLGPSHGLLPESLHWRPTDRGTVLDMTALSLGPER